jgi:hypothetical protein
MTLKTLLKNKEVPKKPVMRAQYMYKWGPESSVVMTQCAYRTDVEFLADINSAKFEWYQRLAEIQCPS